MPERGQPKVIVDPEYLRDAEAEARRRETREGLPDELRRQLNEAAVKGGTGQSAAVRAIAEANPEAFSFLHLQGYDWLTADSDIYDRVSEGAGAGKEARRMANGVFDSIRADDKKEKTREVEQFVNANLEAVMSEYKIHLQPKRDRLGDVVSRLVGMYQGPDGAELRRLTGAFKIHGRKNEPGEKEIFPEVVVYVMPGAERDASGKTEGRRNLEAVLAAVVAATGDLEDAAQPPDQAPRYNAPVTGLVYCAQSGGDLKTALKRIGLLDKFFDPATGGAFRRGERPPTAEELAGRG